MKEEVSYVFKILVVDKLGQAEITTVKSIAMGLSYSERLWENSEIKRSDHTIHVEDKTLGINLSVEKVEANESAFIITVLGSHFERTGMFREKLLLHLKNKLRFSNIKILTDGLSSTMAQVMHPLIKDVENELRGYLEKKYTQKAGLFWWETNAPKFIVEAVEKRKKIKTTFSQLIETDIVLTTPHELLLLAEEVGVTKAIQSKWAELVHIVDRMSYNDLFDLQDYETTNKLCSELLPLLSKNQALGSKLKVSNTAEKTKIVEKKKTQLEPQKAPAKQAVTPIVEKEIPKRSAVEAKMPEPVAEEEKVTPVSVKKKSVSFEMISEKELLTELKNIENSSGGDVDLKTFVTGVLAEKGFATGPSYSLTKNLNDKGLLEIYDVKDNSTGLLVKAIRTQ